MAYPGQPGFGRGQAPNNPYGGQPQPQIVQPGQPVFQQPAPVAVQPIYQPQPVYQQQQPGVPQPPVYQQQQPGYQPVQQQQYAQPYDPNAVAQQQAAAQYQQQQQQQQQFLQQGQQQQQMTQQMLQQQQELVKAQADMRASQHEAMAANQQLAKQKSLTAQNFAFEQGKKVASAELEQKQAERQQQMAAKRATVHPYEPFNPEQDCTELRKAMKGFGCDDKVVNNILGNRSNAQRQTLINVFRSSIGRDLIKDLKSETSGSHEELLMAMMKTPAISDAHFLRKAMKGVGTDEQTLIEILCTRTPQEIAAIKDAYSTEYNRNLSDDVTSETKSVVGKSRLRDILLQLLDHPRDQDGPVDGAKATLDAVLLNQAGEKKWGTDQQKFIDIFTSRSYSHLFVVFVEYQKICNYDIRKSIKREMGTKDLSLALQAIVGSVRGLDDFFAQKLCEAMKGLGTNSSMLLRVVVSRSEIDLADIKDEFARKEEYGKGQTLAKWISDDVRGSFRSLLHILIDAKIRI